MILRLILEAWLSAFVFWWGISLGSLGLLLLELLTGGKWAVAIRSPLLQASATIPWLAPLWLPIVAGIHWIYPWVSSTHGDQGIYLNVPFFIVRGIAYLATWIALQRSYVALTRASAEEQAVRAPRLGAGGLVALAFTVSFASIDWVMSLEPDWYSTVYPMIFVTGQGLSAMAFALLASRRVSSLTPPEAPPIQVRLDLGNVLLAFVMVWAYLSYIQYLVIWSGNLPEEVTWFLRRSKYAWAGVVGLLILFQFFMPFFLLLFRAIKRRPGALAAVAAVTLGVRAIDACWLVMPGFHTEPSSPSGAEVLLTLLALLIIGALWLFVYRRAPGAATPEVLA